MEHKNNSEATEGGVPSKLGLYAYASKYTKEAIDMLYVLMSTSRNEGIKMGSARALLDKCLPDLKAVDLTSQEPPEPVMIRFVRQEKNG